MISKEQYLKLMGIEVWQSRTNLDNGCECSSGADIDIGKLRQSVDSCRKCALGQSRTNAVFGVGDENSDLMFIGEAPGANEDLKGEPFVGRAMLKSISLDREKVYIANILKCRPPGNRDPLPDEVMACTPYLKQQIALIKPKLLVAVGRIAAQFLLNTSEAMSKLRGNVYHYGDEQVPLIVTYHPAYLLRSPSEKRKAYSDFLLIQQEIKK